MGLRPWLAALLPLIGAQTPAPTTGHECPPPTTLDCAAGLRPSRFVAPSPTGGLRPDCPGAARFLRPDPLTGAVVEVCASHPNGTQVEPRALPVRDCGEARIGGLAAYLEHVYYASGSGVRRITGNQDIEIAGAVGEIVIRGANFGEDLEYLEIRAKHCKSLIRISSEELRCRTGDPGWVGPRASPLDRNCIVVKTTKGGVGGSTEPWASRYREAELGDHAPPAIFDVEVSLSMALRTRAVAVDGDGSVFASSLGSEDVFGGIIKTTENDVSVFLRDAPRILGLLFVADEKCGLLYYADASRRLIGRRSACKAGRAGDAHETIVMKNVDEPRGLSLDPSSPNHLYAASSNDIIRIDLASGKTDIVIRGQAHDAPDGVLVLPLPDNAQLRGDRSLRLLWLDANRVSVRAATTAGTRARTLKTPPEALRFPRALALGSDGRLLVGEWLGRIWSLSQSMRDGELLRPDASTAAAAGVRAAVENEELRRSRLQPALYTLLKV